MRLIVFGSLIVLSSAWTAGCSKQSAATPSGPPPAPVRVAPAVSKTVPVEVRAVGNVEAYSTIVIKSQVGGVLTRVHFHEGDAVRKGDLLFEIDSRPYEQAVRQWEANLARDQALLRQAQANMARDQAQRKYADDQAQRYSRLQTEGVISREQADLSRTDAEAKSEAVRAGQAAIESLSASIRADQAFLEKARVDLGYCRIYAPVDGRTGNVLVKQGSLVKATDVELVSVNQIQPIYLTFSVSEKFLPRIRQRMKSAPLLVRATLQGSGGDPSEGRLTFIDNGVDAATGTIKLKATFANAATELWPGQFLDVVLRLAEKPGSVVVPAAALQNGQMGQYVFVVRQDDTVELRQVTAGPKIGDEIPIEAGVEAGERVVTEGQLRLAAGSKVRVLT